MLDHKTYREWLQLELDGRLAPERVHHLELHVARCDACRAERESLGRLRSALAAARIEVQPGFRETLLAALPAAGWEARRPGAWAALGGLAAALALAAGGVVAFASPGAPPIAGTLLAIVDLLRASVVTGAGLLAASWRGVGLAVGEVLHGSPAAALALGASVLAVNLALVRLLRSRSRGAEARRVKEPRP